ncbi:MAG TPA: carboxypeptidase-like regulatory domain-containing protein [Polyangiaceae bacterium]|nr:carboxypeptidase-like regulatory domain-containing protein [Polyangiaceae bacterium]
MFDTAMSKLTLRLAIMIGAISTLGSVCDAFYLVNGRVENCVTRKPIADAKVVLRTTGPKRRGVRQTDADGTFTVAVNDLPDDEKPSDLTVSKDGFDNYDIHVMNPTRPQDICLTPTGTSSIHHHRP